MWRTAGLDVPAVQVIETHGAWVYLGGGHVLKRKKPVTLWSNPLGPGGPSPGRAGPLLDFSTPERRELACREEVRLNRRLAPDVYVGVLAWRQGAGSGTNLGPHDVPHDGPPHTAALARDPLEAPWLDAWGAGVADDWLVWMRRLPAERMLDHLLLTARARTGAEAVQPEAIEALGVVLGRFWHGGTVDTWRAEAHLRAMAVEHDADVAVLTHPHLGLRREALPLLHRMDRLRTRADAALRKRALSGALRDGHGDLRPEHIALLDPPRVIDALEFDPALRTQDPFEELAFLGLECERLGAAWIGPRLMAHWSATCREPAPGDLIPLYTARRALLRARLALAHLLEPDVRHPERWLPLARWYLQLGTEALPT